MYEVILAKDAIKYYKKSDAKMKKMLNECFVNLKENPKNNVNVKRLEGKLEGLYRYRIRDIRVIYEVIDNRVEVHVLDIGNRGDIYK
ncbi:MAG: hypothetical protein A2Y24_00195 [Clostridiales bacterium GWE2_32_10]|nr:MAG: hypothetical protein A2Y24_00195 [Clostridiales bacterium GWE2_32_10]HBY20221.1 type II toxin-antitoxin system RelE/ParE family toxin [Clostridiales bacterium]